MWIAYHPRRSIRRAAGAEGNRSPSANMPARTPVTIEATAAQVDTTIALPCFKPRVCLEQRKEEILLIWNMLENSKENSIIEPKT